MSALKLDLTKEYKTYYTATKKPELVEFGEAQYISIEGIGAPAEDEFNEKVEALYPLAFTIKNITKKDGNDFAVPKLEGLWWVESDKPFIEIPRSEWHWQLIIRMPDFVTLKIVEKAKQEIIRKKKIELVKDIGLQKMKEGLSVQIIHVGPYATEHQTIWKINEFIKANNLVPNGLHHEIYLSDPRRVTHDKLKTILRQPVKKAST